MKTVWKWIFAVLLIILLGVFGFTFTVREGYGAIVMRFGRILNVYDEAGLYFKLVWPIDEVVSVDLRSQVMDSGFTETLTHDKRNIILQTYAVWDVEDPALFYTSVGTMTTASSYLNDLLANAKNGVMGGYDLSDLVSTSKDEILLDEIEAAILNSVVTSAMKNYGIRVQSVRIKRLALPMANLESVYEQMRADRQTYVTQLESEGLRDAEIIKSQADTDATRIIAEGRTQAAKINAETEQQVAAIYADAYSKNPELFKLFQQLSTLENSVSWDTVLVMESGESPFSVLLEGEDVQ